MLLTGGTLANPSGVQRQTTALLPFEEATREYLDGGAEVRRRPRWPFIPESASSTDDTDLAWIEAADAGGAPEPGNRSTGTPATPTDGGAPDTSPPPDPDPTIGPIKIGAPSPDGTVLPFEATVLYESAIYDTQFNVSCKDGITEVRMVEDVLRCQADPALLQYQVDPERRLLLLLKPRAQVTPAEFLKRLNHVESNGSLSPASWIENLRVSGDVNLQALKTRGPLRMRDVEFMGRVVLDECRRDASVVFERCLIARSLEARNCVIDGDLVLRGTSVLGATDDIHPLPPAVSLDGLRLTGSLEAQQISVLGELAAANVDIRGRLALCGMHQERRFDREVNGLTLRDARVKAGIDLSPHVAYEAMASRVSRTRIEGQVDLTALKASRVDMRGVACLAIDVSWAHLESLFSLDTFCPPNHPNAIGNPQMRAIVQWDVQLRGTRAQELRIAGARIIKGNLELINAEIGGCLFASPPILSAYRTMVGGSVILSGARIRGDADFDGASIGRTLEMRTGSLGRLRLSIHPAALARGKEAQLDWFDAEAGGIELIGVTSLQAIVLTGARIGDAGKPVGGVLVEHVELQGDIRFCWGRGHDFTSAQADARAAEAHFDVIRWRRDVSARTCSVFVRGDIEMRCVVIAGSLDLTNLKVGGAVRLNDARIGTDLFARGSWLRGQEFLESRNRPRTEENPGQCTLALECTIIDLDNARVNGDALLSGMRLHARRAGDGRFMGRGLQVGGKLELRAGIGCTACIEGGIELAGASATELSLPGADSLCMTPGPHSTPNQAPPVPVTLEGGRFGKLSIAQPIPQLNLKGVNVANWELGPDRGPGDDSGVDADTVASSIRILKNMRPMDRAVWISVESALRNQAQAQDADRIYCTMRDHEQVSGIPRTIAKYLSGRLYGYGTRVMPAIALWLVLSFAVFAILQQPENVKISNDGLLQLGVQCRATLESATSSAILSGGSARNNASASPAKCAVYREAIDGSAAPSVEITAAQLAAAGAPSGYDIGDAMALSLHYAIPLVGAFGNSDWVPAERQATRTAIGTRHIDIGLAPSLLVAIALVVNFLLLSFAAAFIARRWLR